MPAQPYSPVPELFRRHRSLLLATVLLGTHLWASFPAPASPSPGTVIENQATGSFIDSANNQTKTIQSDIVKLTVAEVAGITVTATGMSGIPNPGETIYFTYTITNVGNDPTQFFIPANANLTGNATQAGNLEITGYSLDGTNPPVTLVTPIVVPNGGGQTGRDSSNNPGLLSAPNANGEFQPNGYVTVRVPVRINAGATGNDLITVRLGDTPEDLTSNTTPKARQQNQPYSAGTDDVYTVDNADSLGVSNEANDLPLNGDSTNHRQEASAVFQVGVTLPPVQGFKSVQLTQDADGSTTVSSGDTLTWTVSYVNVGTTDIENFQITDVLPANVAIASPGGQTITVNSIQGPVPDKHVNYTGTGNNTLLSSPMTLKAGGVVTVSIPVTIQIGTPASTVLSNQAIATGDTLTSTGITTDNVDNNTTGLPTDVTVPANSISQTQSVSSIDPTTTTVASVPNVILVKRITAIDDQLTNPNDGTALNTFVDNLDTFNDNHDHWPAITDGYIRGALNGGLVKPLNEVEYTIYFLSSGNATAKSVLLCDRIPDYQTFVPDAFNQADLAPDGVPNSDRGILIAHGGAPLAYTNIGGDDTARFYPPGSQLPAACNGSSVKLEDNGAIVVNLGSLPPAIAPGDPGNSYGYIRFRAQVN